MVCFFYLKSQKSFFLYFNIAILLTNVVISTHFRSVCPLLIIIVPNSEENSNNLLHNSYNFATGVDIIKKVDLKPFLIFNIGLLKTKCVSNPVDSPFNINIYIYLYVSYCNALKTSPSALQSALGLVTYSFNIMRKTRLMRKFGGFKCGRKKFAYAPFSSALTVQYLHNASKYLHMQQIG